MALVSTMSRAVIHDCELVNKVRHDWGQSYRVSADWDGSVEMSTAQKCTVCGAVVTLRDGRGFRRFNKEE